jgi:hypothetical protein
MPAWSSSDRSLPVLCLCDCQSTLAFTVRRSVCARHRRSRSRDPCAPGEPLDHLFVGGGDEPATDRAAARAANGEILGRGFERARVVPRRHADEHLLDRTLVQRILGAERGPRRQLNLAAIDRAYARATDLNPSPAHHQLARSGACAVGMTPGQMSVPRSDEPRAFMFEHGSECGGSRADHELVQVRADHVGER